MAEAHGNVERNDSLFVWDEKSQLYFHASSGFYHEPNAGWYYSSRDGLYYQFQDGNYVLLGSEKADEVETHLSMEPAPENTTQNGSCQQTYCDKHENSSYLESKLEVDQQMGTIVNEAVVDPPTCTSSPTWENHPPPPSEWLEDTLIDLYLSGYNNPTLSAADAVTGPLDTDDRDNSKLAAEGTMFSNTYELEEGEWIPEDETAFADTRSIIDEDEEKWRAQYGQVVESGKDLVLDVPFMDLWDWELIRESTKTGKHNIARLVGRLVKRSAKRHPSMPSVGGKLRSAPICEVHLDLVRVKTGQVYRLRNPCARYLASLSTYDSANPTKEWGFPQLSSNSKIVHPSKFSESSTSVAEGIRTGMGLSMLPSQLFTSKQRKCQYRDRAAERRILHGGFSVGPGQKIPVGSDTDTPLSPVASCPQDAAAEALEMSFGAGSYARKILESMGWKEGEGLGSSSEGLLAPIQPVGNIGNAGLGWSRGD